MDGEEKLTAIRLRVEAALEELRCGHFIIVCNGDSQESKGDLVAAAELASPELVNFAITHARGLLCQAIDEKTGHYLNLSMMSRENHSINGSAFTVSLDHIDAGTGISASARSLTIRSIASAAAHAQTLELGAPMAKEQLECRQNFRKNLRRPGHIFPLLAELGGVLQRQGHTEATLDLMRLAGLRPSGILCEIIADSGEMACGDTLQQFTKKHHLHIVTVEDLVSYQSEFLGRSLSEAAICESRYQEISLQWDTQFELPSGLGKFQSCVIEDVRNIGDDHLLIWKGDLQEICEQAKLGQAPILRIHSECFTGEVLFSQRCDCRAQLDYALQQIEEEGRGLIIYLRQEGRGIGLRNKLRAYQIQQKEELDTVDANMALGFADDLREYSVAVGTLRCLGLTCVRLLTNNPKKMQALEDAAIRVERLAIDVGQNPNNYNYLQTKKAKSGHIL